MASRRLIAVLLVLLFLSSLAAALAPVDGQKGAESTTSASTSTTTDRTDSDAAGQLIRRRIDTSNDRPPRIEARVGDQLQLEVASDEVATLEIAGLGPTEDVGPDSPARFDVFLRVDDTYVVRQLDTGDEIAKIVVSPASELADQPS